MDWSSLLSALIGGFFALAGVLISLQWTERSRRATRLDELATACRALGAEVAAYFDAQNEEEVARVLPAFQANVLSLQAHLTRWRGDRRRQGFAETVREIVGMMSAVADEGIREQVQQKRYVEQVNLLVVACVRWESHPDQYRHGNITKKLMPGDRRT